MSKVESSSIASSPLPATPSTVLKPIDTDVLAPPSTNGDFSRSGSVSAVQTPVVGSVIENAPNGSVLGHGIGLDVGSILAESRKRSRAKGRDEEEVEIIAQTAARIATNIVADHVAVLHPDVETPFQDASDAIQRLLPYHVFQQPKEDLQSVTNPGKGKRKATEEELLREEIQETKFALECWKRRRALENRFKKARTNSGKRTCHDGQLYVLTQSILEVDRSETAYLTAELKAARQELEKIEREKRAAAPPPRPQFYAPQPPPSTPTYSTPYRGYTYSYGSGYSTQYTYSPYVPPGTTPATYSTATYSTTPSTTVRTPVSTPMSSISATPSQPTTLTPASTSPATSTVKPPTASTSSTQASPHIPQPQPPPPPQTAVMAPIPVQLPSSSLAALSALGIIPVPAANAPPPGQPQPAAVLKGTTQNGTTICLEINVSSLQANQMNGLAIILSALTSRGMNVDGSASSSSSGAASGNPGPVGSSGSGAPSARVGVSSSYQS